MTKRRKGWMINRPERGMDGWMTDAGTHSPTHPPTHSPYRVKNEEKHPGHHQVVGANRPPATEHHDPWHLLSGLASHTHDRNSRHTGTQELLLFSGGPCLFIYSLSLSQWCVVVYIRINKLVRCQLHPTATFCVTGLLLSLPISLLLL